MTNPEESEQRPTLPPTGLALSGLSAGEVDRTLKADAEPTDAPLEAAAPPVPPTPANDDQLALPRGGLVALRKSGGLRFSSRGCVVFRNGWVVPLAGTIGNPHRITDAACTELEALLQRSGMSRSLRKARATPDGYVYELTARYAGRTRYAEAMDGAIPSALGELIEALQRLLAELKTDG